MTIPFTAIIVGLYFGWQKRRERRHANEDDDMERVVNAMEAEIMATLRKRTLNLVRTWDARIERKAELAANEGNQMTMKLPKDRVRSSRTP